MNMDILTLDGQKAGSITLPASVFGVDVRADLLARAVNWQMANARLGLADTKTRGEIDRSKKKSVAQKKTGSARHGAKSSNIFVGGGVAFGPQPRDFAPSLNKKVRKLALKTAMSSKVASKDLIIVDEAALKAPKTADLSAKLAKLNALNATFIVDSTDTNFDLASRNLPHIKVLPTSGANVYDILRHEKLVLTQKAVSLLVARLEGEEAEAEAAPKAARKATSKAAAPQAEAKAEKPAAEKKPAAKKPAAKPAKAE
jgi:large subunit ribosomal protein L4